MVLSNDNPYDSDDSGDAEPWELIDEGVEEVEEAHGSNLSSMVGERQRESQNNAASNNNDEGMERSDQTDQTGDGNSSEAVHQSNVVDDDVGGAFAVEATKAEMPAPEKSAQMNVNTEDGNDDTCHPWMPLNPNDETNIETRHCNDASPLTNRKQPSTQTEQEPSTNSHQSSRSSTTQQESHESHESPMHRTWSFLESTFNEYDSQHNLRRRAQTKFETVTHSLRDTWSTIQNESQRIQTNLKSRCDQADIEAREAAREASANIRYAATSAKDSICRANDEYGIAEKLAGVAVVGGAALVALGNPRAGAGALAVAGASLAVDEVMRGSAARSNSTYTRDYGLREGVHLD